MVVVANIVNEPDARDGVVVVNGLLMGVTTNASTVDERKALAVAAAAAVKERAVAAAAVFIVVCDVCELCRCRNFNSMTESTVRSFVRSPLVVVVSKK